MSISFKYIYIHVGKEAIILYIKILIVIILIEVERKEANFCCFPLLSFFQCHLTFIIKLTTATKSSMAPHCRFKFMSTNFLFKVLSSPLLSLESYLRLLTPYTVSIP